MLQSHKCLPIYCLIYHRPHERMFTGSVNLLKNRCPSTYQQLRRRTDQILGSRPSMRTGQQSNLLSTQSERYDLYPSACKSSVYSRSKEGLTPLGRIHIHQVMAISEML